MRATLLTIGLAASALLFVGACRDTSKDLLSPRAEISKATAPPGGCWSISCSGQTPNFVDISAGSSVSCAVHAVTRSLLLSGASNLTCWGSNELGMLGVGFGATTEKCPGPVPIAAGSPPPPNIIPCSTAPVTVAGGRSFNSVSVGVDHVCAVESGSAAAFCWGRNGSGQLGFAGANTGTPTIPVAGFAFNSIAAGLGVSCGITTAQALVCWGVGFGATPVEPNPGAQYKSVSVEQSYVCGLDVWGQPCAGTRIPYSVVGQANTARHICQIFSGQTECYGDNSRGQLGLSPRILSLPDYKPNVILNFTFQSVATGYDHSCALSGTDAFCWGGNYYGQLGAPSSYPAGIPGKVQAASGTTLAFTKISIGDQHSCAIANNAVFCWGRNDLGQLGIGNLNLWMPANNAIASVTPLRVVGI